MDTAQSIKKVESLLKAASQSRDIATIERFVEIAQEFIAGVRLKHPRSGADASAGPDSGPA
jgi:hypothetical protein